MATQDQIDAIEAAMAKGVKTVAYGGNTVVYQSVADMLAALAYLKAKLQREADPGSPAVVVSKGGFFRD